MENLIKNQKSLIISSLGETGFPEISYAPFVIIDYKIYLYLSQAANHYYNLRDQHKCSVIMIEDEDKSANIFARNRVSFKCESHIMENVSDEIFSKFDEKHGEKMMTMFRKMDFDMFELNIISGRLVKGFGQAYEIEIIDGKPKYTQATGAGKEMSKHIIRDIEE